jgi:hypothetical protein
MPRTFCDDSIRAAFSTTSLGNILSNVANKQLLKGYKSVASVAKMLARRASLSDFKESSRMRLVAGGSFEALNEHGKLAHGSLTDDKYTNKLDTKGMIITLTRQAIMNDDLGSFTDLFSELGRKSALAIEKEFFTLLLSLSTSYFSTASKMANYITGADSAFSYDSLTSLIGKMRNQTDPNGDPIMATPKYLLVPTELEFKAKQLLGSAELLAKGSTDKENVATANPLRNSLEVVSSSYLSNSNFSGYSTTAFYLFADPADICAFEIGYLNGKETPTIEQGSVDFDELGKSFRAYHDFGIKEQDYRGAAKSKGAA